VLVRLLLPAPLRWTVERIAPSEGSIPNRVAPGIRSLMPGPVSEIRELPGLFRATGRYRRRSLPSLFLQLAVTPAASSFIGGALGSHGVPSLRLEAPAQRRRDADHNASGPASVAAVRATLPLLRGRAEDACAVE
jgi:hypothetical protein